MTILKNLQQFGLNPKHWHVKLSATSSQQPLQATLINTEDSQLIFKGSCWVRREKGHVVLQWLSLSLP